MVGIGVGLAACIAPLYIQELSPTRQRGRMVVLKYIYNQHSQLFFSLRLIVFISVVMITLGQVIAYGIGAGFFHLQGGWRWMVGLGAVPAGIQVILLFFLPESREYLKELLINRCPSLSRTIPSSYLTTKRGHNWGSCCHDQNLRFR